jgi:ribulose 1,5-bisphosphate carboxylase large subunit-like protein
LSGKQWLVPTLWRHFAKNMSSYNADKQRKLLSEVTGGSVDVVKDDETGIATVFVNNIKRKNAFSGKI